MKIRGHGRQHYGKHSEKGKENIRHKFSRAMARKGLLEVGGEEVYGEGGRIPVGFGRTIDQDALNQMSIVYRYWQGNGHDAYGDRRKTPRTDHE